MTSVATTPISPEVGIRASRTSPVIVATDGEAQSDAALLVGRLFASEPDAMRLVSVMKPLPLIPESPIIETRELVSIRRSDLESSVTAQLARVGVDAQGVEIREGDPAFSIARLAHRTSASMVVCGLGRHRIADRIFGDETALRLVRFADVPVFAAAEGLRGAPARAVVACDF